MAEALQKHLIRVSDRGETSDSTDGTLLYSPLPRCLYTLRLSVILYEYVGSVVGIYVRQMRHDGLAYNLSDLHGCVLKT